MRPGRRELSAGRSPEKQRQNGDLIDMKIFRTAVGLLCTAALLLCSVTAGLSASAAAFSISGLFSDNAILQQKVPVTVTGFGETGATVTVSISGYNVKTETVTCIVNDRGKWTAELSPRDGSYTKYTITAKCGKTALRSTGILFGEVWIAGGESSIAAKLGEKDYTEYARELLSERARVCVLSQEESEAIAESGLETGSFSWSICSDKSVIGLPEIPVMFALKMRKELDLPVAVICTVSDTSSVASWLGESYIDTELEGKLRASGAYDTADPDYYPSSVYNRQIFPLRDVSAAGVLWAAGEGDRGNTDLLLSSADALISQMRDIFRYDATCSFSFIFAQNEQHLDSYTASAVNNALITAAAKYPFAYTLPVYDLGRGITDEQSSGLSSQTESQVSSAASSDTEGTDLSSDAEQTPTLPAFPESRTLWGRFCGTAAGGHYKTAEYTFPSLLKVDCDTTGAELMFGNTGEGLTSSNGAAVEGFCLIYADTRTVIPVSAEIISSDSVRLIFGDAPLSGASLGYAYGECAASADLFTKAGIPVQPFNRAVNLTDENIEPLTPSVAAPSAVASENESKGEDKRTMLIVVICIGGALLIAVLGIVVAIRTNKRNNSLI